MSQITDHTLPPTGRDGQHDPGEIPGLLEPISNDAADLVIGFRSFCQMPVYRRFGRAALDHVTGAGGAVTDSQSGFRALNKKAALLLAGTLKKDDFSIESEMMRCSHDLNLRMAEVADPVQVRGFRHISKESGFSWGWRAQLGDMAHCRGWKKSCRWWQKTRGSLKRCE